MKNKYIKIVVAALGLNLFGLSSCNDLLDMKPLNEISDASYWQNADQFKLAANEFYTYLYTFTDMIGNTPHADLRSDLLYSRDGANPFSNGTNTIPNTDGNWTTAFRRIRAINFFLEKAEAYPKPDEIKSLVAEAKFFRAYVYFDLFQLHGGVPILKNVVTVDSEALSSPRATREETINFIISDLESAIPDLRVESSITAADKGRISKGAAQGFLGRVALYEGTWQKFRNGNSANNFLDKAIANSKAVIDSREYQLFAPAALGDSAQKYMFILENQQSNPANITKAANREYILANRYDFNLRQIRSNITHAALNNVIWPTKKLADMYLCQDGLPISKSPLFRGYATTTSEFQNRDNRMRYTLLMDGVFRFSNENPGARTTWRGDAADNAGSEGRHNSASNSGYANQKWCTERRLVDNEEAYDYPVIRYAEVLLTYAEAVFERNGAISDTDLDFSINLVRNRVNKTMPKLSNALVSNNGLSMREEIRRERTLELYLESFRLDDLKRWKTAEIEMPKPIQGITWRGTEYERRWSGLGNRLIGNVFTLESSRKWEEKNYLLPIPTQEINLNKNLTQTTGW